MAWVTFILGPTAVSHAGVLATSNGIIRRRAPTALLPCFYDGVGHMALPFSCGECSGGSVEAALREVEGKRLKCGDGDIIMCSWGRVGGRTVCGGHVLRPDRCVIWLFVGGK